jgi:hypothetical protein
LWYAHSFDTLGYDTRGRLDMLGDRAEIGRQPDEALLPLM